MIPMARRFLHRMLPWGVAACAVTASLAQSLSREIPSAGSGFGGLTESQLHAALPGKTLIRVPSGEFQRIVSLHSSEGRMITGPALAALVSGGVTPNQALASASRQEASRGEASSTCRQADSLKRRLCLDSLARENPAGPKALREIENSRHSDTLSLGADTEEDDRKLAAEEVGDEVQQERTRGYIGQFMVDLGKSGGSWDGGDWVVVLYVVVGVIVVGAFVLGGGKALYDLIVNKDESPVFKEAGLRFSYSGLTMRDAQGGSLYRDAYLVGLRFAFGVEKPIMSMGLAVEGGSIDLTVSGLNQQPQEILDFTGGYLVGGPMVRFGNYHPLALTLEFLNGTSTHESIGWISKSRVALAGRTGPGLLVGAHVGAVFYDLRYSDGLVFRRGDLNRDLSLLGGVDLGWDF